MAKYILAGEMKLEKGSSGAYGALKVKAVLVLKSGPLINPLTPNDL
jgi:hypothetical protein